MKIDPIKKFPYENPNINNPQKNLNPGTLNKTRSMKIPSGQISKKTPSDQISTFFGHTIVVLQKPTPKMSKMFSAYNGAKPQASNQTRNSIKKVD
jgi:hypothetical protein